MASSNIKECNEKNEFEKNDDCEREVWTKSEKIGTIFVKCIEPLFAGPGFVTFFFCSKQATPLKLRFSKMMVTQRITRVTKVQEKEKTSQSL